MTMYTPESINQPDTYNLGGRDFKVKGYIKIMDKEADCQFYAPLVDIPMLSDYKWQLDCLNDRLEHPERYKDENLPEVIERLKLWLQTHQPA